MMALAKHRSRGIVFVPSVLEQPANHRRRQNAEDKQHALVQDGQPESQSEQEQLVEQQFVQGREAARGS